MSNGDPSLNVLPHELVPTDIDLMPILFDPSLVPPRLHFALNPGNKHVYNDSHQECQNYDHSEAHFFGIFVIIFFFLILPAA